MKIRKTKKNSKITTDDDASDQLSNAQTATDDLIGHIAEELQDGYGFYLEGSAIYHLHGWRQCSNCAKQIHDLKTVQYFLQKLIEDIEEHGTPRCFM